MAGFAEAQLTTHIINPVLQATRETFEMMLGGAIVKRELGLYTADSSGDELSALIGLTGQVTGAICLNFPAATARQVVSRLVDSPGENFDALLSDSVGELANMVGGGTKDKLRQYRLQLGLPVLSRQRYSEMAFPACVQPLEVKFDSEFGPFSIAFGFTFSQALNILIVDGDAISRTIVRRMSLSLGYPSVIEAGTVGQGLALAREKRPALIVTAQKLPDGTAASLAQFVRRTNTRSPILLLSEIANAHQGIPGINDTLVVPFTPTSLRSALLRWVTTPGLNVPVQPVLTACEPSGC